MLMEEGGIQGRGDFNDLGIGSDRVIDGALLGAQRHSSADPG